MAREREGKMKGIVKKDLYFRKTPEKADNIIKILHRNQGVNVVEDLGEWLKVKVGKTTGYVMAEYVAFAPEATEEAETTEQTEATEEADGNDE